jgi:hypothetical protein
MEDRVYEESSELKDTAERLVERYYEYLGHVDLENIYFAAIQGSKPKKTSVMQIGGITSEWVKKLIKETKGKIYCISVWASEWDEVFPSMREWMIFDALLRIDPHNDGKLIKPDVNEFGILIEYIGPYWRKKDDLPSLLDSKDPLPIPLPAYESDEGSSVDF